MDHYFLTLINEGAPLCTIQRLKAKCDEALSNFAFNFKLRRYNKESTPFSSYAFHPLDGWLQAGAGHSFPDCSLIVYQCTHTHSSSDAFHIPGRLAAVRVSRYKWAGFGIRKGTVSDGRTESFDTKPNTEFEWHPTTPFEPSCND